MLDFLNTMGVSSSLLRVIDRRQRMDAILVYGGMFVVTVVLILMYVAREKEGGVKTNTDIYLLSNLITQLRHEASVPLPNLANLRAPAFEPLAHLRRDDASAGIAAAGISAAMEGASLVSSESCRHSD